MTEEEKEAIEYFKNKIKNRLPLYEETYVDGKPYRRNILQLETNFTENQANKTEALLYLIQKQDTEINKLKEKLDITKTNYEILQGEMDRIGIDTLHLEAGSSTDDVIEEINKLNNVIDRMAEYMYKELDFAYSKEMVIEHFVKEDK